MISPGILALVCGSILLTGLALGTAILSLPLLVGWRSSDTSERQLHRERRLLLIEASFKTILVWQLLSTFLFIAIVEDLHPLFTGAMCAAGTLNASSFGYPALTAKLTVFFLGALFLVIQSASQATTRIGVLRFKVFFSLLLLPALAVESLLQLLYFRDLDPQILTSCCSTIFNPESEGFGSALASISSSLSKATFFTLLLLVLATGGLVLARGRGIRLYTPIAILLVAASLVAVIVWIAPAHYQLPTHHCPFCLLSAEQGFVGYPLFVFLATALISAAGAGALHPLRSLDARPGSPLLEQRRLCAVSLTGFVLFVLVSILPLLLTDFRPGS